MMKSAPACCRLTGRFHLAGWSVGRFLFPRNNMSMEPETDNGTVTTRVSPDTGKRPRQKPANPLKKRDYKGDLAEIQGRVDMALKLFGKCQGLPTLAEAAVEILEGK